VHQVLTSLADASVDYSTTSPVPGIVGGLIGYVLTVIALWPVFRKAGRPGWGALIPIYNSYLLVKVAGLHGATILLYLIPIVNLIFSIVVAVRVARGFGHGGAFGFFLLWLLSIIGYLVIGYGPSRYVGPNGVPEAVPAR
jgi:Family of unknown function (DUF5684)